MSTPLWRECVAFYVSVFGVEVAERWEELDDQGAILAFSNGRGEAYLELYQADRAYDVSGISLQFKVPDIQSFLRSLPIGLEYEGPNLRPWGSTYLYLRDPAGVLVIVYEGGLSHRTTSFGDVRPCSGRAAGRHDWIDPAGPGT